MPEEESKGVGVLPALDFGTYIAFFLPGALALYALVPVSPRIGKLFDQIVDKDSTVGATFLLLTGGLVVGTVISGLRAAFFDSLIVLGRKPKFNYDSLKEKNTLVAYKEAIANTYRFYQFYGNMFLALSLYLSVRYFFAGVDFHTEKALFYLGLAVWLGLAVQSHKALAGTYDVIAKILGVEKAGAKILTKKLPEGKVGQLYKYSLDAGDGQAPVKWSCAGTLPTGITLDPCGGLSGTPTAPYDAVVKLQIQDAAAASDAKEFPLKINA